MRTEQVIVYASGVAAILLLAGRGRARDPAPLPFLLAWLLVLSIPAASAIGGVNLTAHRPGSMVAGIDNLALPIAMMLVTWSWITMCRSLDVIRIAARAVVSAMSANALLTVVFFGTAPAWLRRFWSGEAGETVAERAAQLGRYSGVFNQPAEAGVAYSLAMFCLLYVVVGRQGNYRPAYFVVAATLLTVGGILTASKIFLVGGLPITIYLIVRDRRLRSRTLPLVALGIGAFMGLHTTGVLPRWDGAAMIQRLLGVQGQSAATVLTSGRLGDNGTLAETATSVLDRHSWFGVGIGGLRAAYDSLWIEALVVGGVTTVGALTAVLVGLVVRSWRLRITLPRREWVLALSLTLLTIGSSIGVPTLTGNRISTLVWALLGLTVTGRMPRRTTGKAVGIVASTTDRQPTL